MPLTGTTRPIAHPWIAAGVALFSLQLGESGVAGTVALRPLQASLGVAPNYTAFVAALVVIGVAVPVVRSLLAPTARTATLFGLWAILACLGEAAVLHLTISTYETTFAALNNKAPSDDPRMWLPLLPLAIALGLACWYLARKRTAPQVAPDGDL